MEVEREQGEEEDEEEEEEGGRRGRRTGRRLFEDDEEMEEEERGDDEVMTGEERVQVQERTSEGSRRRRCDVEGHVTRKPKRRRGAGEAKSEETT